MRYLRNNTATIVTVGPFYDKTDGVTIETGLTITNERITLIVDNNNGSAPTLVLDNVTGATSGTDNDLNYITNNDAGLMQLELAAGNVNYFGRAMLSITDAANHVPVFHEFIVLPANVYDSLVLGSGTDYLQVDAVQVEGVDATDQINAEVDTALNTAIPGGPTADSINERIATMDGTGVNVASQSNIDFGALQKASLNAATPASVVGAVGSVTGAVGSVTGAVGSVTGAVGSVTGAVGSVAANGITATSIAADAINAASVKAGAVTKIQNGLATPTNITAGTITTVTNLTNLPATAALEATLTAIKGAGWSTETLAAMDVLIDAIKAKTDLIPASPAAVGSQMDLVNAPNGTAVTAIQSGLATGANQTTILARLGAWTGTTTNTILGALRSLMNKAIAAPTDITSGGTYDASTDSLEGIRDTAPMGTAMRGTDSAMLAASYVAPPAATAIADQVWDEAIVDHAGAGSTGAALSAASAPSAATVADAVWDELTAGHAGAGSTGAALAAAGGAADPLLNAVPGAYAAGTAGYVLGHLNSATITVTSVVTGTTVIIVRGDTVGIAIAGLGNLTGHAKIWFSVKSGYNDSDAESIIQVEHTDGLKYLNGAIAVTSTDATLGITDEVAGDILITLKAALTSALPVVSDLLYDVQWTNAAGAVATLTYGACNITGQPDVTRAIA